jgi:hypothetical protein
MYHSLEEQGKKLKQLAKNKKYETHVKLELKILS